MAVSKECCRLAKVRREDLRRKLRLLKMARRSGIMKGFTFEDREMLRDIFARTKRQAADAYCSVHHPKPPKPKATQPESASIPQTRSLSARTSRGSRGKMRAGSLVTALRRGLAGRSAYSVSGGLPSLGKRS